ncbi:MAG: rod shape-determining protein MreD [Bacillota bacterium]|nr:rod shape-determining protein MreD [Bacillota bacterium]
MKIKNVLILNLLIFFLQSTIMQYFRIVTIIPNLNLIIIVILVIYFDLTTTMIYAVVAGLLQDLFLSPYIGINIFIYLITSLTIINFESVFNKVSIISPIFLITIATSLYNLLFFIFIKIMNLDYGIYRLFDIAIVEIILNMIWIMIIYKFVQKKIVER